MNVSAGAKTDPGQRSHNEDTYAVVDTRERQMRADGVLIIADGMGGRKFGEEASKAAVETVEEALAELLNSQQPSEVVIADALVSALRRANARVYEIARSDEEHKGMGTTCVAAVIESDRVSVAHAGDSRAYLLRDNALRQLTHDHSYIAEQVRAGAITEEGARRSRFRNIITRAVGIEPTMEAETTEQEVRPGDILLLCTDGLSNAVAEADIARALAQASSPQAAADRLVNLANQNGGKDNITAVVAKLSTGTRTLRMQAAEMALPAIEPIPEETQASEIEPAASLPPTRPRRSALWPTLALLFLALGVGASGWLAHLLIDEGYRFEAAPPFAVPPAPPAPSPAPPDPAHVAYDPPALFYAKPVRGSFLSVNPADGSVSVATLSGTVVALPPEGGAVRYKFGLPFLKPQSPAPPGALGANGVTLHTATDPQGNFYVSNALTRTVTKYQPNGVALGLVAHSSLKNPQAIGAAPDGTIYLIDAERLKVLHAKPSTAPLPPIPAPRPPAPAVPAASAAPAPAEAPAPEARPLRRRRRRFRSGAGGTL